MPELKSKPKDTMGLRSQKSREALRGALLSELGEKTFQDITVKELTANARIGYATFFRHYEGLDELLVDLAKEQIDKMVYDVLPVMEQQDTLSACRAMCTFIHDNWAVWSILLTGGASESIRQELMQLSTNYAGLQTQFSSTLPDDLGITLSVSTTIELLIWWLRQAEPHPIEELAQLINEIIHTRLLQSRKA